MLTRIELDSAARSLPDRISYYAELWTGAMFLQSEAYMYMRERRQPFGNGLLYVALVGFVVAVANILGAAARYATSPNPDAIRSIVLTHLQALPFYAQLSPQAQRGFDSTYAQIWNQFGSQFVGFPVDAGGVASLSLGLLTTPLGLVIGWLIFGALVHLVGRGWNPETSYGELLATLALAHSPQVLYVLNLFPGVAISGLVVGLWTLILNVFAVRIAYKTTTGRAIWGALFPTLLLVVLLILLIIAAVIFFIPVSRTIGGAS